MLRRGTPSRLEDSTIRGAGGSEEMEVAKLEKEGMLAGKTAVTVDVMPQSNSLLHGRRYRG